MKEEQYGFFSCTKSPRSNLYDSYELKAVLKQLNRAIQQGSNEHQPLSPTSYVMNSPYYRRRLAHIIEENAKGARKITKSQNRRYEDDFERQQHSPAQKCTKGLGQLWKKVKHRLISRKHRLSQPILATNGIFV